MIRQIKNYLKKYHQANLWLEHAQVREQQKQALQVITEAPETVYPIYDSVVTQSQIVFSNYDVGHTQEETQKIQNIYSEIGRILLPPTIGAL